MGFDVQPALNGVTVLLNLALALAVGAGLASLWLAAGTSDWAWGQLARCRALQLFAIAVGMLAMCALLLLVAASMAEVPIGEAGEAVRTMLAESHFGMAWLGGMGALAAAALAAAIRTPVRWRRSLAWLNLFAIAGFFYTRSMVSHAAADGDLNPAIVADWFHLCLVSAWVGVVFIAAFRTLAGPLQPEGRADAARYIGKLSLCATVALAGIGATGLFGAWHKLGSLASAAGSDYGKVLAVKLALVVLAVVLGGYNRFIAMPALLKELGNTGKREVPTLPTFKLVLRIEAVVLLAVLVCAALLSATAPPAAG